MFAHTSTSKLASTIALASVAAFVGTGCVPRFDTQFAVPAVVQDAFDMPIGCDAVTRMLSRLVLTPLGRMFPKYRRLIEELTRSALEAYCREPGPVAERQLRNDIERIVIVVKQLAILDARREASSLAKFYKAQAAIHTSVAQTVRMVRAPVSIK